MFGLMSHLKIKHFFAAVMLLCGIFTLGLLPVAAAEDNSATTQARLQELFNQLEVAGNSYNAGGGDAAWGSVLSTGCSSLVGSAELQSQINDTLKSMVGGLNMSDTLSAYGLQLGQQGVGRLMSGGCSALSGQSAAVDPAGIVSDFGNQMVLGLLSTGQGWANQSGLPFLSRLELETGSERGNWVTSVTTVQPIWRDEASHHHIFTQLAWRQVNGEKTVNAGLAYRHLNEDKDMFYGANVFFDHGFEMNHNRMSVGADIQTSLLGASLNRYIPLSDWRARDDGLWEEKAAGGWDLELNGQVPMLPSWTGSLKGYQWDGSDNQYDDPDRFIDNTYGYLASLEYAPVSAFAVRGGFRHESDGEVSGEFAMRFNLRFNEPLDLQFKPRLELTSVEDRIYQKVSRENTIRIQERRTPGGFATVIENVGANSSTGQPVPALSVGQALILPATVSVANTVGAYVRIRFVHGGILTIGQNSTVTIEPELLTLVSGTMQYVSGSTNVVVNVPGGTVTLMGTDIDIVSNGTNSTVRVREGSVRLDGKVSGSNTIGVMQMAQAVAGAVSTVAAGTAPFVAHTDDVSIKIDRPAATIVGTKVAPYPIEAPRMVTTSTTIGQTITIGLRFNSAINVSGGPPRLPFTINGNTRNAVYSGGSGTSDLQFNYVLQASDAGASTNLTVTGFDNNGATIIGDGKAAVTTIADATLNLGAAIGLNPTLVMNFLANTYELVGVTYNSLTSFLTATAGTFSRASIGTYYDAAGVLQTATAGTPRFDYDPVTHAARGLLIEDSRTNPYQRSSEFNNAYWNKTQTNVTADAAIAPDGTMTADLVVPNATNNFHYVGRAQAFSAVPYTISVYMKTAGRRYGSIQFGALSYAIFDLQNGVVAVNTTNGRMVNVGNGWYRCSLTVGSASSSTGAEFTFRPDTAQYNFTGDGVNGGYMWGAQLEQASYATSFIPTTTVGITRAADTLSIPTGSWYNAAQGTVLSQYLSGVAKLRKVWALSDGTANNTIETGCTAANTACEFSATSGGANQYTLSDSNSVFTAARKSAVSFRSGAHALSTNGAAAVTTATGTVPSGITGLSVGRRGDATQGLDGHVQNITFSPTAVTNSSLQTMSAP